VDKSRVIGVLKTIGKWIPALLLVLIFIPAGWDKFNDAGGWARAFRIWGYPDWFRILVGVLEVGGALLLLYGRTAAVGALIILVVMLGGSATHIILENGRHVTSEVVPITLSSIVLIVRRRELRLWMPLRAAHAGS